MSEDIIRRCASPLAAKSVWLRLMAILSFIQAGFAALTIIGLLYAWIPAWMGVALWKGTDGVQNAATSGDAAALEQGMAQLGTYFTIMGVMIIVGIIGALLLLGFVGLAGLGAFLTSK